MRGGGGVHGGAGQRVAQVAGGIGAGHRTPPTQTERSGADGRRNRGVGNTDEHGAPHPPVDNFSGLTTPLRRGNP